MRHRDEVRRVVIHRQQIRLRQQKSTADHNDNTPINTKHSGSRTDEAWKPARLGVARESGLVTGDG